LGALHAAGTAQRPGGRTGGAGGARGATTASGGAAAGARRSRARESARKRRGAKRQRRTVARPAWQHVLRRGTVSQAIKINPNDPNVSTDLGVAYYYTNQPDRALAQFDHSLKVDPKHIKTLLNVGIVRAFGKQDLPGAARAWQQVVDLSPDSPEGQAAKKGLDGIKSAHPDSAGGK
jgi:Tfp pilus assembly protein PilF